jgi:hypothetical protein
MDIERAIGIIEKVFTTDLAGTFALEQKQCIINLIRRGEKYEAMWRKLRDIYLPDPKVDEGLLKRLMDSLEQKYFPKPIKKTITIEIEAKDEKELFRQLVKAKYLLEEHFEDGRRRNIQYFSRNFDICGEKVQVIIKDKGSD